MIRPLLVALLAAAPAALPFQDPAPLPDAAAWQRALDEVAALEDDAAALARIDALEAELDARLDDPAVAADARMRLAELLVRARIPRQSFMAQGASANRAIALLEQVLADAPDRVDARFLHGMTCANMPEMFGRRPAALASFERLLALERERPGSVPYPAAFARLARMHMEDARRAVETGLAAFPDDPALRALAGLDAAPGDAAAPDGAPTPAAAPPVGDDEARASKRAFSDALLAGELDFERLDAALAAGERLAPDDHEYPLFRGLLRLWKMESTPDAAPALTAQAEAQLRRALELDPSDTRIYGWLGPLLAISGHAVGSAERVAEGEALMDHGVQVDPEQNLFARAFADRAVGARPERVADDLYRTFELCTGAPMDRARFLPAAADGARSRPGGAAAGDDAHPACGDPATAPYNRAGTAYWAAEFFRGRGDEVRARDAYRAALRLDPGRSWPYRALAEQRLALVEGREAEPLPDPVSCLLCHRAR